MKPLWEILVPTIHGSVMALSSNDKPVKTAHHRVWDKRVREIAGGLTILKPGKGQWVNEHNKLFCERMIPVRIMAIKEQMEVIAEFTIKHYNQEAVMYYKITDECHITSRS